MIRWYKQEMILLYRYSMGWAFKFGVPGRRWLIIPLSFQGFILATAWLVVSPIIRYYKPPVFKPWFIGRCHLYMRGGSMEDLKSGLPVGYW